jgi:dTDP-4-amino-4,6-dideoxygalactose transaminase
MINKEGAVAEKYLSWWEPAFGEEEARTVADVVRRGYVNEGALTKRFTDRVAEALGVRHVLATNSGTVSLFLALKACGVQPGDEVIVPSLTFIATANAVAMCAARPVLADIRFSDLNVDPDSVESLVTARTRAIIPVHINGRVADMQRLRTLASKHGLALIEDAAQALGSRHAGAALGTLGDAGCVSLAPTKIITSGQGGLLLTDRDDIRDAVIRLKDHGRLSRSWNYHPQIGFNFKYSDVYAAIADTQWDRMAERTERSRRQFVLYRDGLAELPGIRFISTDLDSGAIPLWVDALADDAGGLMAWLKTRNIDCRPFWPAIHTQEAYPGQRDCPNAAYAAAHGVWFPSGAGKSEADIARVIDEVRRYLTRS